MASRSTRFVTSRFVADSRSTSSSCSRGIIRDSSSANHVRSTYPASGHMSGASCLCALVHRRNQCNVTRVISNGRNHYSISSGQQNRMTSRMIRFGPRVYPGRNFGSHSRVNYRQMSSHINDPIFDNRTTREDGSGTLCAVRIEDKSQKLAFQY